MIGELGGSKMDKISNGLNFRFLLLENYKTMSITEEELVVIFMLEHLIKEGNTFVTADLLSLRMNYSVKDIDTILVKLINKGLLEYKTLDDKTITSLRPLYKRLHERFKIDFEFQYLDDKNESVETTVTNLYERFQNEFGRPLSPLEIQRISEWFQYEYSENEIIDALNEATSKKQFSIKTVDRILLQKTTAKNRKDEGYSTATDANHADVAKVLEKAKQAWMAKNDEE